MRRAGFVVVYAAANAAAIALAGAAVCGLQLQWYVAIAVLAVAMMPHFIWLMQVNFVPLTYAGESYHSIVSRTEINGLALGYVGHNFALLALPAALAGLALGWPSRWRKRFVVWSYHPKPPL